MATQSVSRVTEEAYLKLERGGEFKSEFVDGQIFAMAGGSLRHSAVSANWIRELGLKLAEKDCIVYTSDARVRTTKTGSYLYPDVTVACGQGAILESGGEVLVNPLVIVEVLSPSTVNFDRGKKFQLYREFSSLQDYLLTYTDEPRVEHFSRQADSWLFYDYQGLDASVVIPSVGCTVEMSAIYHKVSTWTQTSADV